MSVRHIKMWHDDVRPAPDDSWIHVRTNDEAKVLLYSYPVSECSLDHDLGYDGPLPGECDECEGKGGFNEVEPASGDRPAGLYFNPCAACDGDGFIGGDVLYVAGGDDDNGFQLVKWMVREDIVPDKVTIHSWNPDGAENMAEYLANAIRCGALHNRPEVVVKPYTLETR